LYVPDRKTVRAGPIAHSGLLEDESKTSPRLYLAEYVSHG
jgi:hypothetical protein